MADYKGIVEIISTGAQHHFEINGVETKAEAENKAIKDMAAELQLYQDQLDILVCMEILTDSQVQDFLNSSKTISELNNGDHFEFNYTTYTVEKKYQSDESPLKTECGQLFHNEDLPVKYVGKKEK